MSLLQNVALHSAKSFLQVASLDKLVVFAPLYVSISTNMKSVSWYGMDFAKILYIHITIALGKY